MRKVTTNLIKLTVSISLIFWLISGMDPGDVWQHIEAFNLWYLVPFLGLSLAGILVSVWKWGMVLQTVGLRPAMGSLLRLFWVGVFFNNFLPGRTGGDLVRAYGISRTSQDRVNAVLSVAIDRGLNLIAIIGIGVLALVSHWEIVPETVKHQIPYWALGVLLVPFLIVLGVRQFRHRLGSLMNSAVQTGRSLIHRPGALLIPFALSALYQTTMILSTYAMACALSIEVALETYFFLIPITALVTMLPISLNGFGLREGAYVVVFAPIGILPETAIALSVVNTLGTIGVSLIGGILYAMGPLQVETQPHLSISSSSNQEL